MTDWPGTVPTNQYSLSCKVLSYYSYTLCQKREYRRAPDIFRRHGPVLLLPPSGVFITVSVTHITDVDEVK